MVNPRLPSSYSAARACRWFTTSSTGSSNAEANDISVTGSSMTISTASIAPRTPPGKSLMSKATCSSGSSLGSTSAASPCSAIWFSPDGAGASLNWIHRLFFDDCVFIGLVELVTDTDLAVVQAGPPDRQLCERLVLVEGDGRLVEQLQQCQEPRDDDQGALRIGDQRPEGAQARRSQPLHDQGCCLLANAHRRGVQVLQTHGRHHLGRHG